MWTRRWNGQLRGRSYETVPLLTFKPFTLPRKRSFKMARYVKISSSLLVILSYWFLPSDYRLSDYVVTGKQGVKGSRWEQGGSGLCIPILGKTTLHSVVGKAVLIAA
ncbi:hypothetical protein TNIN_491981 [Trichonephila inaurata madagascariensis]|uniref:Uncharacterized protein n=1 Tax=Trichonephila inaurata madagascariensis TaxID=2747483 RepID=A0A8X6YWU2_9ARAC|nr:hypothetical protein TNIN_491981 [Trichonephila inaurata madagascariensis]